jgi:hypothetical protein
MKKILMTFIIVAFVSNAFAQKTKEPDSADLESVPTTIHNNI